MPDKAQLRSGKDNKIERAGRFGKDRSCGFLSFIQEDRKRDKNI